MHRTEVAPAFQLYVSDFLSDTLGMTLLEKGAYASAMAISWRYGGVPTDTRELARLLGVSQTGLAKLWTVLGPMFERRGERWVLPWQEKQRLDYAMLRLHRSEAGRRGNEVRWKGRPQLGPQDDSHAILTASQGDPLAIPRDRPASTSVSTPAGSGNVPTAPAPSTTRREVTSHGAKPGVRETAAVFAEIRSLARSNGISPYIPADAVRALGARAWAAYNAIGGADRLLNLNPKDLPFVIREFREAYTEDPSVEPVHDRSGPDS